MFIQYLFGGPKGVRTPDLRIANAALYQLSYGPIISIIPNRSLLLPEQFPCIQGVSFLWQSFYRLLTVEKVLNTANVALLEQLLKSHCFVKTA